MPTCPGHRRMMPCPSVHDQSGHRPHRVTAMAKRRRHIGKCADVRLASARGAAL